MSIPRRERRRDRLYIIAQILSITQTPVLKSHIMYGISLSFAQLNEYLKVLLEWKLLDIIHDKSGDRTAYITTKKGLLWLDAYKEIKGLMRPV